MRVKWAAIDGYGLRGIVGMDITVNRYGNTHIAVIKSTEIIITDVDDALDQESAIARFQALAETGGQHT